MKWQRKNDYYAVCGDFTLCAARIEDQLVYTLTRAGRHVKTGKDPKRLKSLAKSIIEGEK